MPATIRCSKCEHEFPAPTAFPATCPRCGRVFGPILIVAPTTQHGISGPQARALAGRHAEPAVALGAPTSVQAHDPPQPAPKPRTSTDSQRILGAAALPVWIIAGSAALSLAVVVGVLIFHGSARDNRAEIANPPSGLPAEELYRKAAPAVVAIISRNETGQEIARGSGFRIDDSIARGRDPIFRPNQKTCYVLTNFHVIRGAARCDIQGEGGVSGGVTFVSTEDEAADLALLKVLIVSDPVPRPLSVSQHDPPAVGTSVYAIGNPLGLQNSLSEGIVSAVRVTNGGAWIQTTAPISHGSSGGPLLTTDGSVIGVTTATYAGGQNLNRAVPASTVLRVLNRPFRGRSIWEGSSLAEEEKFAYLDAAMQGAEALEVAQTHFRAKRFDGALGIAESAAVPAEFEFLRQFMIGKCHIELAIPEVFSPSVRNVFTNGHVIEARRALERAKALNPTFSPALYRLVDVYKGLNVTEHPMFRDEQPAAAFELANLLVELAPRCANAYLARAQCGRKLQNDAAALRDLDTAIGLDPTLAEAHYERAGCLAESGDIQRAEAAYRQAEASGYPAGCCEYGIGLVFQRAGNFERAIAAFEQAQRLGLPGIVDAKQRVYECRRGIRSPGISTGQP